MKHLRNGENFCVQLVYQIIVLANFINSRPQKVIKQHRPFLHEISALFFINHNVKIVTLSRKKKIFKFWYFWPETKDKQKFCMEKFMYLQKENSKSVLCLILPRCYAKYKLNFRCSVVIWMFRALFLISLLHEKYCL